MSDLSIEQAIDELRDLVRCRCHPGFKDRGLRDPSCDCDSAEAVEVLVRALPVVQPHVNETPKSEHDAANVLTPATKGDWQPIETAPKRRVIDLWSVEGERYPDAVWGVCGDAEGWTDANDHRSLGGGVFTHWRDRPAPPATKGVTHD